ncbi:MAG TPA: hypothetical protein V6D22_14720 [Candidatus Obscuribacterales bacterium]
MAAERLLDLLVRSAVAALILAAGDGQAAVLAQTDSTSATTATQTVVPPIASAAAPQAASASLPPTGAATAPALRASKPKHRRLFAAWLHAEYDDRAKNAPATEEQLVKDADDYNHRRQWIDDCPVDEFIITPGGGS